MNVAKIALIGVSQEEFNLLAFIFGQAIVFDIYASRIFRDTETCSYTLDADHSRVMQVTFSGSEKEQLGDLRIIKGTLSDVFGSMVRLGFPNYLRLEAPQYPAESQKYFEPVEPRMPPDEDSYRGLPKPATA